MPNIGLIEYALQYARSRLYEEEDKEVEELFNRAISELYSLRDSLKEKKDDVPDKEVK